MAYAKTKFSVCMALAMLLGASVVPGIALAQEPVAEGPFAGFHSVDDQSLKARHGRDAGIVYNLKGDNNLSASISDSTITAGGDITNGGIGFSDNAMQNFQGMSNFVANTGQNNNLQATMTVNIVIQ